MKHGSMEVNERNLNKDGKKKRSTSFLIKDLISPDNQNWYLLIKLYLKIIRNWPYQGVFILLYYNLVSIINKIEGGRNFDIII